MLSDAHQRVCVIEGNKGVLSPNDRDSCWCRTVSVLSDAHQRVCVIVHETKVSCLQTTGIPAGVGLCQC